MIPISNKVYVCVQQSLTVIVRYDRVDGPCGAIVSGCASWSVQVRGAQVSDERDTPCESHATTPGYTSAVSKYPAGYLL